MKAPGRTLGAELGSLIDFFFFTLIANLVSDHV